MYYCLTQCVAFKSETKPETFETKARKNGSEDSITGFMFWKIA